MKYLKKLFLFLLVLNFLGCSNILNKIASNVHYKIENIDIKLLSNTKNILDNIFTGNIKQAFILNVTTDIEVINNNPFSLVLNKVEYKIFVNDTFVGKGEINYKLKIPSNDKIVIKNMPIQINLKNLSFNLLDMTDFNLKIEGKGYINTFMGNIIIPFEIVNQKIFVKDIMFK